MANNFEFNGQKPDFLIRSLQDREEFRVHRSALRKSDVFSNMFLCCDHDYDLVDDQPSQEITDVLELDESSETLRVLLRLLHFPPPPPPLSPSAHQTRQMGKPVSIYEDPIIPYPLLSNMLRLVDKYELSEPLRLSLHSHMFANASICPLEVYGFATSNGLNDIAAEASAFLLHPPLSTYSKDRIATIPSAAAYHDLVRLHTYRIQKLKEILLHEDIFPFGYGACTAHKEDTTRIWKDSRILLATRVEAATDLAEEMSSLSGQFESCKTCHKACVAATEMLRYKCNRVPRTIDYLPPPQAGNEDNTGNI